MVETLALIGTALVAITWLSGMFLFRSVYARRLLIHWGLEPSRSLVITARLTFILTTGIIAGYLIQGLERIAGS